MGIFKWIASFLKKIELFFTPSPAKVVKTTPAPAPAPKVVKAEAPKKLTKASLSKLTKAQIEAEGKKFGIDVDRRKTKASIIEEVLAASKKA
mgnify:CR=1 FL=1|jgi:hypothetical protein|tara:strand:- start:844 stop:1119 length:276 start_codon:yes stop_codon:yes gene_type:complete